MILTLILLLVISLKAFDFLYLFQIKEYRLDRFFSQLYEDGLFPVFYSRSVRLPAKTPRNLLIALLLIPALVGWFLIISPLGLVERFFILLVSPLIGFFSTLLLIEFTSIFVSLYREIIIAKAIAKVKKNKKVKFIGITGSFGKTTTKEILYSLLSRKYHVAKTKANNNTDIGVALSVIKDLKPDIDYFIVEMGAYKKNEIVKICKITPPSYAIITALSNQHLSLFGSRQNLIRAKKELLLALPASGKAYLSQDLKKNKDLISGLKCQIKSVDEIVIPKNIDFPQSYHLNAKCAYALAYDLGISTDKILQALAGFEKSQIRLNAKKGVNGSALINDSYNSNQEGFVAVIEYADKQPQKNKIILSKGIIELGNEKKLTYQKIIKKLQPTNIKLYTTDKLFKYLDKNNQVTLFSDEKMMTKKLSGKINKDTLIVIEGKFSSEFINTFVNI